MAAKFKFQLESLKKLRQLKLTMAKADLASVGANLAMCDQKIAESHQNVRDLLDDERRSTDMTYVKLFSHLGEGEHDKIDIAVEKRKVIQAEFDRHSAFVSFLRSELKAVEKHEETQREIFHKETERQNAKKLDEVTAIQWVRKTKVLT